MSRDLVCGIVMLALAVTYYLVAAAIPVSMLADAVGPGGLPKAYGLVLGGLSILLIVRSLLASRQPAVAGEAKPATADEPADEGAGRAFLTAIVMLAFGAAYIALVDYIGYPIAIALLVGVTIFFQGGRQGATTLAMAVGAGVLLWLIFVYVLQIPQPMGFLGSIGG